MEKTIQCPQCQARLLLPADLQDAVLGCPRCGNEFRDSTSPASVVVRAAKPPEINLCARVELLPASATDDDNGELAPNPPCPMAAAESPGDESGVSSNTYALAGFGAFFLGLLVLAISDTQTRLFGAVSTVALLLLSLLFGIIACLISPRRDGVIHFLLMTMVGAGVIFSVCGCSLWAIIIIGLLLDVIGDSHH